MKYDFTKITTFFKQKKLQFYLFFSCFLTFFLFGLGYVLVTKQYILLLINFSFVLTSFILFDMLIGKRLYND